jgi:hypothetical protein
LECVGDAAAALCTWHVFTALIDMCAGAQRRHAVNSSKDRAAEVALMEVSAAGVPPAHAHGRQRGQGANRVALFNANVRVQVEVKLRLPDKAAYEAVEALVSSGWRATHQQARPAARPRACQL